MGGWEGESGPTSQNFTSSPFIPPHQRFIFPLNNNFHVITQYKLHFYLQSLLLYHHFFFKFMLYVHIFHASFDFSWCWYLQNVVSSIEKVQINPTYPLLPHPSSFYFQIPFWEVSPLPFGKTCKLWKDCWKITSIVFKKKKKKKSFLTIKNFGVNNSVESWLTRILILIYFQLMRV